MKLVIFLGGGSPGNPGKIELQFLPLFPNSNDG